MPQITDIKPQVKKPGYYNILVDGKFALALSELDLSSHHLKVGQQLSPSELSDLHKAYTSSKCYNFALRYLATRPRSIKEVEDYLIRKNFSANDILSAIERLVQCNYLDDTQFAKLWVENRMRLNPKSVSILKAELIKKGIDKDIITTTLSQLSSSDQLEGLIAIVESKARQSRYQDKQKIIEYLARKGYNYGLIKEALGSTNFYQE
jgi:regulatory protein